MFITDTERHSIHSAAIGCATVVFLFLGLLVLPGYWFAFRYGMMPEMLSREYFAQYNWSVVYCGGACDQGGLTKLLIFIVMMQLFSVFGRNLLVRLYDGRVWRSACNLFFLFMFALPAVVTLVFTWELSRTISVMGVTPGRITGIRCAILAMSIPLFCLIKWNVGKRSSAWMAKLALVCVVVAYSTVVAINAAAQKAMAAHPRPSRCLPNYNAFVPDVPETRTAYGLTDILFGVR